MAPKCYVKNLPNHRESLVKINKKIERYIRKYGEYQGLDSIIPGLKIGKAVFTKSWWRTNFLPSYPALRDRLLSMTKRGRATRNQRHPLNGSSSSHSSPSQAALTFIRLPGHPSKAELKRQNKYLRKRDFQ